MSSCLSELKRCVAKLPAKNILALSLLAAFAPSFAGTTTVPVGTVVNNSGSSFLGILAGQVDVLNVVGAGTQWNSASFQFVALSGTGTLNIEGGGVVSNTAGLVGYNSDGLGAVKVSGTGSQWNNSDYLSVGDSGTGALNIENGGAVVNTYGYIGSESGSHGTATVNGVGSQWNNSSSLSIGDIGTGLLNIENNGVVRNTVGYVGYASGSSGLVTVSGAGSQWNNSGSLFVGVFGTGTLYIENNGVVRSAAGYVGGVGSKGIVTVSGAGSQWQSSSDLRVGSFGNGTLNIENGGVVTCSFCFVGYGAASEGIVTVSGFGSQWSNVGSTTSFAVGLSGKGALNIENGGVVTSVGGHVGYNAGSSGTVTVSGVDSRWDVFSVSTVGSSGTGTLNIENGGVVSIRYFDYNIVGQKTGGNGTVRVSGVGSKLYAGDGLTVGDEGTGALNITAGGFVSTRGHVTVGKSVGGLGAVKVSGAGSELFSATNFSVGVAGTGNLKIEAGGSVSAADGYVGYESGGVGAVNVSGAGSAWNSSNGVSVGYGGNGALNIENGGVVSGVTGYVGHQAGSFGAALVKGAGSQWNNSAVLYVGDGGTGTLTIEDGGVVNSSGTFDFNLPDEYVDTDAEYIDTFAGFIGYKPGSNGTVKVSGVGSQWNTTNHSSIAVGYEGAGALIIENGGVVNNGYASDVGEQSGSNGSVIVTGVGSQWNTGTLSVGRRGAGALNLEKGGVVNSASSYVGFSEGGSGVAVVSGAGSQWNTGGELWVGAYGSGTLRIESGGVVVSSGRGIVGNGVISGGSGKVTVTGAGSSWTAGELNVTESGVLNIENGGLVSSSFGFVGRYSGLTGAVKVTGAGSLWRNTAEISVGGAGIGTLDILDSGKVTAQTVQIGAQGKVNLGEGAQLITDDGAVNIGTVTFNGDASIVGSFTNNGSVLGSAGTLRFLNDVNGAGSYAGNIVFQGAFNPGNSPAAINFNGGNVTFDSTAVLNMEVFGDTAGAQYDQLLNIGTLTINGTLNLVFGSGYVPLAGSTITLFDYDTLIGSFGTPADGYDRITVTGYDRSKLSFSNLGGSLSMSVTAVPEPQAYLMVLSGLALMGALVRRRRTMSAV
jgi:fibronectin-binding autotransporter adhesin